MKKRLFQLLFVTCALLCSAATAVAQSTVKGQVVDQETGEPLIGASVTIDGTSKGTITDIDGFFTQSVPTNGTIKFSYIGYVDLKRKITKKDQSI